MIIEIMTWNVKMVWGEGVTAQEIELVMCRFDPT